MKPKIPRQPDGTERNALRQKQLHHLIPQPSKLQARMLPYSVKALDAMIRMSRNPDALILAGHRLNRLFSGLRLRCHRVDDRNWPYLEGGHGEAILMLHGFGADKDRLGSFLPMMRRDFHVIVPDVPGFGEQRQEWASRYDVGSQVYRIERFIESLGLEKFHLMGISLGGYLAAYYASQNPHRVSSLCLIDSAGFSSPVSSDALQLFESERLNIFLPRDESDMQLLVDYLLHRPLVLPKTLKRYWLKQTLDLMTWRIKLFDDLLSGGIYLMDDLACRIKAPTLVVWGAEDRVCHVSTVDSIMDRIEDCLAYILHDCGHIPILEHPALSARLYRNFLWEHRAGVSIR